MYTLIGLNRIIVAYAVLAGIVTTSLLLFGAPTLQATAGHSIDFAGQIWGAVGKGLTFSALVFGLGQTRLFPRLCRRKALCGWLADIDGKWRGTITSNWPQVGIRASDTPREVPAIGNPTTDVTVQIRVRLFTVSMVLKSDDGYSSSQTISMRLDRDPETDQVRIAYVYANTTKTPAASDTGAHHGAALLDLEMPHGQPPMLDGLYWTNRNWTKGLNTAGRIRLERAT